MIYYHPNNQIICDSVVNIHGVNKQLGVALSNGELVISIDEDTIQIINLVDVFRTYTAPEMETPYREIQFALSQNELWTFCKVLSGMFHDPNDPVRKLESNRAITINLGIPVMRPRGIANIHVSIDDVRSTITAANAWLTAIGAQGSNVELNKLLNNTVRTDPAGIAGAISPAIHVGYKGLLFPAETGFYAVIITGFMQC